MILAFCSSSAFAELPDFYPTSRAQGMGNTSTAVANDDAAIWTNPAGVARVRKARSRSSLHLVQIPNFVYSANAAGQTYFSDLRASSEESVANLSGAGATIDKPAYFRMGSAPTMLFDLGKNNPMAFGLFTNHTARIATDDSDLTQAQVNSVTDVGGVYTIAFANKSNRINFGLNIRPGMRYAYEGSVPAEEVANKSAVLKQIQKESAKGTGLGVDAGAMFTLADFWFPTLGIAVRNLPTGCKEAYLNPYTEERQEICGTLYALGDKGEDSLAAVDPMDIRVGAAITPRLTRKLNFRFTAEAQHLYLQSGTKYYGLPGADSAKLAHAGIEFLWGNPMDPDPIIVLRAGSNQTFVTFGATLNLGIFSLDFASYGVDISNTSSPEEDRRTTFGMSMYF